MEPKTILITGMSGIKIEASLQKFIHNHKGFRGNLSDRVPLLIKFDTEIENSYYERNPDIPKNGQVWKDVVLQQSYPVLQDLWEYTFDAIVKKISEIRKKDNNKVIFINLHSCYYHNRTQEYLSLINLKKLAVVKPEMIITFIDDIYDIHHRLTMSGGIFHDESHATHTQMILRLMRLLDWRAKETMLSKFIANNLNIKNYVLAVKHSFDTLSNLIFEDYKKVYLSHPITEVRRLEKKGEHIEAKNIMAEITDISDRLSYNFSTFLPTSIDEFRIKNKTASDGFTKNYYSVLSKRWEAEQFKRPNELLYIDSGFDDVNELWKKSEDEITKFDDQINHLLEALSDTISDQVTIRDYTLVEQSDMLVIYRPVFNGNASGGVREEFRYYKRLIKDTGREILCFIYCPQEDIDKYYIRQFEKKLLTEIEEEGTLQFKTSSDLKLSEEEKELIKKAHTNELLLLDAFDKVLDKQDIKILVRNSKTPLGENKIKEFKNNFVRELKRSFQSVEMYEENVTYFENKNITIEEFLKNIYQYIKK